MKAYLYVEGVKALREVSYLAHEVWAMHMGYTFRARRLRFGSGVAVLPAMGPDYVVPIGAEVVVYVATELLEQGGLSAPYLKVIEEQLIALDARAVNSKAVR